jgi:quinol monooxygenase YgiN
MGFIQLIEFRTTRLDEFNATLDAWLEDSKGWRTPTRAVQARDRDNPGQYVHIVEFPSYEQAMENSARPETAAFAQRLAALCEGAPTFRNLDVLRDQEM